MAHPTVHGTLVANTVATHTLTVSLTYEESVIITYRGGPSGVIWYTLDGSTPVAAAAGTYFVSTDLPVAQHDFTKNPLVVKLLSTVAAEYSVMVY